MSGVLQLTSARVIQARIPAVLPEVTVRAADPISALVAIELSAVPCHPLTPLAAVRESLNDIYGIIQSGRPDLPARSDHRSNDER